MVENVFVSNTASKKSLNGKTGILLSESQPQMRLKFMEGEANDGSKGHSISETKSR